MKSSKTFLGLLVATFTAVSLLPQNASAQTEELLIQYRENGIGKVLNVTYGASTSVVELQDVVVSIGETDRHFGALQIRMPLSGAADKCSAGALLTQRLQSLVPANKDVRVFGLGKLMDNGPGEGIAKMKVVRGCFFQ